MTSSNSKKIKKENNPSLEEETFESLEFKKNLLETDLGAFRKKLNKKKNSGNVGYQKQNKQNREISIGFRILSELVSAILVSALIGWSFDHFLNTKPFGLIIFLFLGFFSGVLNILRDSKNISSSVCNVNEVNRQSKRKMTYKKKN